MCWSHCVEAAKEEEAEDDDDMDGFQTDDDDEDGSGFDKEMGVDADDGEEPDTLTLRQLAEQVCWNENPWHFHAYMIWI